MRRTASVVAVVGIGLVLVSSCGIAPGSTIEDDATLSQQVTAVRLDDAAGGVRIEGRAGTGQVALHREVSYRGAAPTGPSYEVTGGVLLLRGCGPQCSLQYTATVPAGLPVTGTTGSGRIALTNAGSVDVTTGSGKVELDGIEGPVTVRTSNGAIKGRGLAGTSTQARTTNGEIDLTLSNEQDVQAETSNGAIELRVPAGSYRVSVRTDNGSQDVTVPDDPAGKHRIDLRTSNGAIKVKQA